MEQYVIALILGVIEGITECIPALCQMLGCSPYESCLAPIICMVGAILFAQK